MTIVFRIRVAAIATALLLTLSACGSDATSVAASGDGAESEPAGPALSGTFTTVAGGQLDLGSLDGQDTVLWFWAPW